MDLDDKDAESTVWCRAACGQNLHKLCFDTWARTCSGRTVTCPLCRSRWEMDETVDAVASVDTSQGLEGEDGYINVADQLGISGERGASTTALRTWQFCFRFWLTCFFSLQMTARIITDTGTTWNQEWKDITEGDDIGFNEI